MRKIERALISVYDKTGVEELARGLAKFGVALLSTGGTARVLRGAGLKVKDVSEETGFPEILDGRVKTLHPKVHGGLLYRRGLEAHRRQAEQHGIQAIDLAAVNLYPFEQTIAKPGITEEEAIEQVDIGGPAMLRSAAKNHEAVTVICDPTDYGLVLKELGENGGQTTLKTRRRLAAKVYAATSRYDAAIAGYLEELGQPEAAAPGLTAGGLPAGPVGRPPPAFFSVHGILRQGLRYGENPHQGGAFYAIPGVCEPNLGAARQIHGKELSFNNLLDLSAALELAKDFAEPCACVIKHNNPCGCAAAGNLHDAFKLAYACDPLSAFGGVLGFNRPLDEDAAREVGRPDHFIEAVIAPAYTKGALDFLTVKPKWSRNVRLLETGPFTPADRRLRDVRVIPGGMLVQDRDCVEDEWAQWRVATRRAPTEAETASLKFAQRVCKHVRSNAIVFVQDLSLVGVGAGQMSRVDSVELAARKAGHRAAGAVMGSDAFFPFPDGVETAARAGITAVIQPGGSVKDKEVIAAADELGLAMVFTGLRHFKH
jgi:phosphoribosylaminoimidazolecarboxamide formyltransferase/IMP cyclohydrolase